MREAILRQMLVAAALLGGVAAQAAVELPGALRPAAQDFRLIGSGRMTWFGLHLYDAALWSPARKVDFGQPFALALRYARGFKGERIAERSVVEIERLGMGDAERRAQWGAQMKRIFPDVQAGDTLTGVYRPGVGAEFFHRDVSLGTIADPEFARAFFSIWLDERTREPKLRERLIGNR
jgi:hypothetical protein